MPCISLTLKTCYKPADSSVVSQVPVDNDYDKYSCEKGILHKMLIVNYLT